MQNFTLNCKGKLLSLDKPVVMAILNVTPDSFFDGGKYNHEKKILPQVERQLNEGAAVIDIGAVSTRPDATVVSVDEELKRVIEPVKLIHRHFPEAILSIDTFNSKVAEEAVQHGASIINDISSATEDKGIFEVAAKYACPYILMHRQGNIQTMHQTTIYDNLLTDIFDFFTNQIQAAINFGIKDVIIDVGFGFSKTMEQNYTLLKNLPFYKQLNKPILVGLSRKSMLYKFLNTTPEFALNATTAANMVALQNGASVLRVHDVKEAIECIQIHNQLLES
jgi:dihydropteroate synthase